jgi:hypothetical protein
MKKVIGWFIIISLCVALIVLFGLTYGWFDAFCMLAIAAIIVVLVVVSCWLITDED